MTDEELDALEALDKAATPGPWAVKYEQFDDEPYVDEIHGPDEPSNPLIETDCGIYGPKRTTPSAWLPPATPSPDSSLRSEGCAPSEGWGRLRGVDYLIRQALRIAQYIANLRGRWVRRPDLDRKVNGGTLQAHEWRPD